MKLNKLAISIALCLCAGYVSAAVNGDSTTITQNGDNGVVDVKQDPTNNNEVTITQGSKSDGAKVDVEVLARGNAAGNNLLNIIQGNDDAGANVGGSVTVKIEGKGNGSGSVTAGTDNTMDRPFTGSSGGPTLVIAPNPSLQDVTVNAATEIFEVQQYGTNQEVDLVIQGNENQGFIKQGHTNGNSSGSTIAVTIAGSNNLVDFQQSGDDHRQGFFIDGSDSSVQISQDGKRNDVFGTINSDNSLVMAYQMHSDNTLEFNGMNAVDSVIITRQSGHNQVAEISVSAENSELYMQQSGWHTGHIAKLTQTDLADGSLIVVKQWGDGHGQNELTIFQNAANSQAFASQAKSSGGNVATIIQGGL